MLNHTWHKPHAFDFLVFLHNIITQSVPTKFSLGGTHHYVCIQKAYQEIDAFYSSAAKHLKNISWISQIGVVLPGFGKHAWVDCSM